MENFCNVQDGEKFNLKFVDKNGVELVSGNFKRVGFYCYKKIGEYGEDIHTIDTGFFKTVTVDYVDDNKYYIKDGNMTYVYVFNQDKTMFSMYINVVIDKNGTIVNYGIFEPLMNGCFKKVETSEHDKLNTIRVHLEVYDDNSEPLILMTKFLPLFEVYYYPDEEKMCFRQIDYVIR